MKKFTTLLCFAMLTATQAACQKTENSRATVAKPCPPDTEDSHSIICYTEVPPRFPGWENDSLALSERKKCADEKLLHFIYSNLNWPRDFCGEGTVVVRFTVETDGSITDPKVVRDIGGGCGEEALRVVKMMPNWVPGQQGGRKVRIPMNLPVRFKLDPFPTADTVYTHVDEMPRFPGCEEDDILGSQRKRCADQKMLDFLFGKFNYPSIPPDAIFNSLGVAKFVVETDGVITNASVSKSYKNAQMDEELLRVIRSMPKWRPGRLLGKPVRVEIKLPLRVCVE